MIESLDTHRVNTLTELCRIERVAAACESEEDTRAFQGPMTAAWDYYVSSNQMLSELRGLTKDYPFCGEIVSDALIRVRNDPDSNRSWNLAWLCLVKIQQEYVVVLLLLSAWLRPGGADASDFCYCAETSFPPMPPLKQPGSRCGEMSSPNRAR